MKVAESVSLESCQSYYGEGLRMGNRECGGQLTVALVLVFTIKLNSRSHNQ